MYIAIHGQFVIHRPGGSSYQPDGDTLRFEPRDPGQLGRLNRLGARPDSPASVRFEAIDALEKDQARGQDPNFAARARDEVFRQLGLGQVALDVDDFTVNSADRATAPGYLLAHSLDKYGRVIGFVFQGASPYADGALVTPTPEQIGESVNFSLASGGFVYPTFYGTLPPDLRQLFSAASRQARTERRGLWSLAVGTPEQPAHIRSLEELRSLTLFPTLHRRLDDYLKDHSDFGQLRTWIRERPDERNKTAMLLATGQVTDLAGLVSGVGSSVRLTVEPEEFVFIDGPAIEVPIDLPKPPLEVAQAGDVVIIAALVNPAGADRGAERITLLNTTGRPVDLAGWQVADNRRKQDLSGILGAGDVMQIVTSLELGNDGDHLVLSSPKGEVDRAAYTKEQVREGRTLLLARP